MSDHLQQTHRVIDTKEINLILSKFLVDTLQHELHFQKTKKPLDDYLKALLFSIKS